MPFSVPIDDICLLSEWKCIVAIRVLVNDDASNEFSCVCETVRWKTWSRWAISASLLAKTWCRHVTSSYLAKKQIGKRFMSVFITMPSIQITFTCSALVLSLSILPCTFGGFVQNISSFFFCWIPYVTYVVVHFVCYVDLSLNKKKRCVFGFWAKIIKLFFFGCFNVREANFACIKNFFPLTRKCNEANFKHIQPNVSWKIGYPKLFVLFIY